LELLPEHGFMDISRINFLINIKLKKKKAAFY